MLKPVLLLLPALAVTTLAINFDREDSENKCDLSDGDCARNYKYDPVCIEKIRDQISRELEASVTYLAAGAHFSKDTVSRPGIANIFWEHTKEEREHAFKLADYLNMRGDSDTGYLRASGYKPLKDKWSSGLEALRDALRIEKDVTRRFTNMIAACETDWHAADWLTAEMLEEQHRGVRDFTGHITRLKKMVALQPNLAEYMFDHELQQKEKE